MKNQRSITVWLLWCLSGCAGGQTGEPDSEPALVCAANAVTGPAAEDLFARFEGTYEGSSVRTTSEERCPAADPVGVRVVITRTDQVSIADRPCGTRYVAVSVTVTTDDGELDSTVDGWLDEEGRLSLSERAVYLDTDERSVIGLDGFEGLRSIEGCCVKQLSDASLAVLADLGATERLDFVYHFPDRTEHQTRLVVSLAPATPLDSCGTVDTAFEIRNADGELAASGPATVTYRACQARNCLSLGVSCDGVVNSEAALLGNDDLPGTLTELDMSLDGRTQGGVLSVDRVLIETNRDDGSGIVLGLEQ